MGCITLPTAPLRLRCPQVGEQLQRLDGSATITFFKNLDAYLKAEQVKFAALFSEFDRGRKGYLERGELAGLVRRVMPEATDAQIRFLAVSGGTALMALRTGTAAAMKHVSVRWCCGVRGLRRSGVNRLGGQLPLRLAREPCTLTDSPCQWRTGLQPTCSSLTQTAHRYSCFAVPQTVLDENNDKVFTQQELLGAARKVVELLRQQQAGGGAGAPAPEVAAVLDRISRFLVENMVRSPQGSLHETVGAGTLQGCWRARTAVASENLCPQPRQRPAEAGSALDLASRSSTWQFVPLARLPRTAPGPTLSSWTPSAAATWTTTAWPPSSGAWRRAWRTRSCASCWPGCTCTTWTERGRWAAGRGKERCAGRELWVWGRLLPLVRAQEEAGSGVEQHVPVCMSPDD